MHLNIQSYGEKEMLNDALITEKSITADYNASANECSSSKMRDVLLDLLNEEHDIQADLFDEMHARGYYPTPTAEEQMIQQAKQKFFPQLKT